MKIYLAGSFNSRNRLRPIRDKLWEFGNEVVSSWLDEVAQPKNLSKKEFYKKLALKDIAELKSADLVIVDVLEPSSSGGRDTELGLALGAFATKQIFLVGPPVSVFHELVDDQFASWDMCLHKMNPEHPDDIPF
ncbi:MAG: hypothetical protein NUV80_07445 [Candidatus Berkelbacteria bacterium]|nr:hypothetical protein [Candidatus Berkelbacteria bacterium]